MGTHEVATGPIQPGPWAPKSFKITSQTLLDLSQAGVYRGNHHIPPLLGLFGPICVPYPKGLNC